MSQQHHTKAEDGFAEQSAGVDIEVWLSEKDLTEGRTWQGQLVEALLLAGDDEGDFRVAYALRLTVDGGKASKGGDLKAGSVVGVGERHQMKKVWRQLRLGDEVRFMPNGEKKLPGGRTMTMFQFSLNERKRGTGPVIQAELDRLLKMTRTAASVADGNPF